MKLAFWNKEKPKVDPNKLRYDPRGLTSIESLAMKAVHGNNPPPTGKISVAVTDNPSEAVSEMVRNIASETPREVISVADKETVAFHVANINGILESVASRRQSLTETRALRREQFEADDAADAAKIAELDRLTAVYQGALKIAAPSGDDGYGRSNWPAGFEPPPREPAVECSGNLVDGKHLFKNGVCAHCGATAPASLNVDPARLTEVGKRIAKTRRKPAGTAPNPVQNAT
jgi:hypothetical protein